MKLRQVFGVVVLAAFAAHAAAQEAVTIKFGDAKAGDRIRVTEEETADISTLFEVEGKPQKKDEKAKKVFVYVDECVTPPAAPGKKPLKATRTYEKIEGSKDGKPLDASLVGKTILIEKKGEKYAFTADGEAVTGAVAAELDQAYNKPEGPTAKDLFPTTPVKPGEPWKMDAKKALAGLADDKFTLDAEKATMSGKLVKAYQKDGVGYGVFEVKASIPVTGLGPKNPLTVKPGSSMTMALSGDGCIDGTTAAGNATTKMLLKINATTMGIDVTVVADVNQKKTTVQLPKK